MLYSIDEIVIGELGTSITIGLNTNLYKPLKIYTVWIFQDLMQEDELEKQNNRQAVLKNG